MLPQANNSVKISRVYNNGSDINLEYTLTITVHKTVLRTATQQAQGLPPGLGYYDMYLKTGAPDGVIPTICIPMQPQAGDAVEETKPGQQPPAARAAFYLKFFADLIDLTTGKRASNDKYHLDAVFAAVMIRQGIINVLTGDVYEAGGIPAFQPQTSEKAGNFMRIPLHDHHIWLDGFNRNGKDARGNDILVKQQFVSVDGGVSVSAAAGAPAANDLHIDVLTVNPGQITRKARLPVAPAPSHEVRSLTKITADGLRSMHLFLCVNNGIIQDGLTGVTHERLAEMGFVFEAPAKPAPVPVIPSAPLTLGHNGGFPFAALGLPPYDTTPTPTTIIHNHYGSYPPSWARPQPYTSYGVALASQEYWGSGSRRYASTRAGGTPPASLTSSFPSAVAGTPIAGTPTYRSGPSVPGSLAMGSGFGAGAAAHPVGPGASSDLKGMTSDLCGAAAAPAPAPSAPPSTLPAQSAAIGLGAALRQTHEEDTTIDRYDRVGRVALVIETYGQSQMDALKEEGTIPTTSTPAAPPVRSGVLDFSQVNFACPVSTVSPPLRPAPALVLGSAGDNTVTLHNQSAYIM